jgi:endo-1,4-beta-xylanase
MGWSKDHCRAILRTGLPGWLLDMSLHRREFIGGLAANAVVLPDDAPLHQLAAARNICFGSEITASDIRNSPIYASLVARECAIITPGIEAKWPATEPAEGQFAFAGLEVIVHFARTNQLRIHMHNLIWAVGLPAWTLMALSDGRGEAVMRDHIAMVAGRFRGQVASWDVINEPIDPRWPSAREGLCTTPWRRGLGANYVPVALRAAHAADPTAELLINDDDLEYEAPDRDRKRATYLRLIEGWLRAGVPLTGFGLEAHLKPWLPLAERSYRRFLHDLAGFGLTLHITELDVCDRTLPPDICVRDHAAAAFMKTYLDIALDEPAIRTVITWGLSDRFSSMINDTERRRSDGRPPRPLPYDANLQPKPMRMALAQAFRGARHRPA